MSDIDHFLNREHSIFKSFEYDEFSTTYYLKNDMVVVLDYENKYTIYKTKNNSKKIEIIDKYNILNSANVLKEISKLEINEFENIKKLFWFCNIAERR